MKLEAKKAENYISIFFRTKVPFFGKTFRSYTMLYNSPSEWVYGYSSRTNNGRYVLFQDYDNLDLESIEQELKYLQKKFNLSNYYIFKLDRENSYHAVCIDTFPICKAFEILKETSCDSAFINAISTLKTREWILRIGKKGKRSSPKYEKTLFSKNTKNRQSTAHKQFLIKCGVPEKNFKGRKWDGFTKLSIVRYDTANRIN